ncbi:MAG: Fe2+-dependent dioxygenase [Sphingomonadaceae bacterium]|nr:Fe2+-dependent dioxygenase [Sphingomonadaceae bacterium]
MFKQIHGLLNPAQIAELRQIAERSQFVDGRVSNPHSKVKNNLHLADQQAYQRTAQLLADALLSNEDFFNFAFPAQLAPPLLTKYHPGMHYGLHPDAAFMPIGKANLRADLSCTIFLNEPESYEGGALRVTLGDSEYRFRLPAGAAIVYPSSTLHEVEPVTKGERLVGLTFIESRIRSTDDRWLLYELNEVAALEGLNMSAASFTRLQAVQQALLRRWAEK